MFAAALVASASTTFIQTFVKAMALGSVYVMMALGFVIIFKATQVLNFAAGALSMAGAIFFSILIADGGIPFTPFDNPLAPAEGEAAGIVLWLVNVFVALGVRGDPRPGDRAGHDPAHDRSTALRDGGHHARDRDRRAAVQPGCHRLDCPRSGGAVGR